MTDRRLRKAVCKVTLVAGAGTGTWKDPDTVDGSSAVQIELEYAPTFYWTQRTTEGAAPGNITVTSVTKTGITLDSSDAADVGVIRCYAVVKAEDI